MKMTRELKLLVGIPASGKSTWAAQEAERLEDERYSTAIISRDKVRKCMLNDGDDYFSKEKAVFNEFVRQINECLEVGIDFVFVDATHINPASRNKTLSNLRPDPNTNLVLEILPVETETAIKRNKQRTGFARVPDAAIERMQRDFKIPTRQEFTENTYGFNTVILKCHGKE